jgi:hypothetical protein
LSETRLYGNLDKFRFADNPPGTRTNGSLMSASVCIANGSVPITKFPFRARTPKGLHK